MTTPAGFIPSPLDHTTPLQGQQMQPARAATSAAASRSAQNGALGYPPVTASWTHPGPATSAGQANSPAVPADAPAPMNGIDGAVQAAMRGPVVQGNGRENGIAPTTPNRGAQLSAPFKLVAPNADMKDIPATFVGASQVQKTPGGALRGRPPGSGVKPKDINDRPRSAQQEVSASAAAGSNASGAGISQPVIQHRPADGHMTNGHGMIAPQPLLLPNGHVAQIAPLTPEQLAELAQNTQLKNQLYAQLLYRSMAQAAPGQAPMQLHHLLNLSPPLLIPASQQHANLPPPDLVQNLLMMPMAQAQGSGPMPAPAQPAASAWPQPSASTQQPNSPQLQSKAAKPPASAASPRVAAPAKTSEPTSQGGAAGRKAPIQGPGETQDSDEQADQSSAQPMHTALEAPAEGVDEEMTDVVNTDESPLPQAANGEADAMPSKAANVSSAQAQSLAPATKPSGATLASSSSGNIPAAAETCAEEASTPLSRGGPQAAAPPLIIRNWGSVGGGFVPFGAGQQKIAPKGGKVLPQGSVKAKPSAAIGAALGPNLVLPNGNVSGPRACAPVEAFELPGSVAKSIPAPSTVSGGPSNSDPVAPSATPPPASQPTQAQMAPRLDGPAYSNSSLGAKPASAPAAPKPKAKSRAQLEGEERKRGPAGRTSMYKIPLDPTEQPYFCSEGVTKHRRSGRWEAHVWVREDGKQAYLGGYSTEEEAAEAHDVAALKCHGLKAKTNFHISRYTALLDRLDTVPMAELVMAIRRTSPGFTRGSSSFRGVTQHKSGRWEVRIGLRGSKHVYLGLHTSEVEAARVYDRALVLLTGQTAATNFPVSNYKNQSEAYEQRISKGEELPGFQEDGEYSERAFEAWLRDQAILPAQEEAPTVSRPVALPKSPEAAPPSTEIAETPKSEAPKPPVPRRTAPERKRKPPAALLDNDSEGSSPPALALNGSPRPGAKRKRTALVMKRPRTTQHVNDGTLNLSQVGKPKQGRPGTRRKTSEPSDNDTAAILMNLAAVAGEASGRPGSAKSPNFRSRASRRQREEEDVEISDEEEEAAAMAWSPGRKHQADEADNDAEVDPDLAYHVFVSPSALILGEPAAADEMRPGLTILKNMGATAAEIEAEPGVAQLGHWDLFTAWLGLCSVVGHMGHTMAILALQYDTPAQ